MKARTGSEKVAAALAALLLWLVCYHAVPAGAQTSQIQSIPLYTGWNLISFQVNGNGFTPQDILSALGSDSGSLMAIWGYDAASASWLVFQPASTLPPVVASLQGLYPGKGYWIKVSKGTTLQLTGTPWNGTMTLVPGWNLVGFPGLSVGPAGKTDFASVFRGQLSSVPVIWSFAGGTQQRFVGYDTIALPPVTDLGGVQPGVGYWVLSTANLSLASTPVITLPPDSAAPRGPNDPPAPQPELFQLGDPRYAGTNEALYVGRTVRFTNSPADAAYDLNHNGILDDPYTQDTMLFAQGVNQENISLFNTGVGLMNWYIVSSAPWLSFTPPAGATSTEQDTVQVMVDRTGLAPGFYTNSFTLYAGSTVQTVTVILQVPTIAGDYAGYATTATVNGKSISIGNVDLSLSLFNESSDPSDPRFHGVINSDRSLLFPSDVYMNGIFYQGLSFSLTTSFPMAPADRDAPPYTSFGNLPANTPGYQGGVLNIGNQTILHSSDVNSNGVLDVASIFPFSIRREITLIGTRTTADHLEGTYTEAISGPLPAGQRIYIQGSFVLDRQTLTPTLKSIYNIQTSTNVIIGGSAVTSYTNSLCVGPEVHVQGVTVGLNINFPDVSQLDVVLYNPDHTRSYDFGTNVAGLTTFALDNFNGTSGAGCWELVINWTGSGLRGYFNGWNLNLDGLAYYSVSGTVVDNNSNAVSGAVLALIGSNVLPQSNTSTNGGFELDGLTENEYVLNVSKLGYAPTNVTFNIDAANVYLPPIVLTPLTAPTPVLSAQPAIGQAPLNVSFVPIISPAALAALGANIVATWNFGDGTAPLVTPLTNAVTLSYIYTNGGSYQPSLVLAGSGGSDTLTAGFVTALAAQPNVGALPNAGIFAYGGGFLGSFASSPNGDLDATGRTNVTDRIIVGTNIVARASTSALVYQESERDSASFSFYRNPYGPASGPISNLWDTAFFVQPGTPYALGGGTVNVPTNQQFRIISTLGGYVFPVEAVPWTDNSAREGEFVLQSGRVED
ncbi:MAG: carboxypeptidase regulatory-like domain-containing protein [Limisphaerales bacterium]